MLEALTRQALTNLATSLLENRYSVIPIRPGSKQPAVKWETFQRLAMPRNDAERMFSNGCNIGLVCGAVSGNLECLDFDLPDLFQPFLDTVESVKPELRKRLSVWQQTPSGGFHLWYRCSEFVSGNTKLAMSKRYRDNDGKPRQDTWLETRGEGGYALIEPSTVAGKTYRLHGDLTDIPTLTADERDLLHGIACTFDEGGHQGTSTGHQGHPQSGDRPGDWYERKTDWQSLMTSYGWTFTRMVGDRQHWTRPGKTDGSTSATLNDQGLFVFSTSTPLPNMKPLSKFAVYTYYEHSGDFTVAAQELARRYGMEMLRPSQDAPCGQESPPLSTKNEASGPINPLQLLETFTVKKAYTDRLGKEEFLIDNLLIRTHILVVVALSGGGKTAFFYRYVAPLLASKGCEVLYLDCDSPTSDHPEMRELAEHHGFRFLNPDANQGASIEDLKKTLRQIADADTDLTNWVFVFDTLKKFADLMQKNAVKDFFKLCRRLTSRGASIVLLAHANKFRSTEGFLVPEGVGDVRSDTDELIIFERNKNDDGGIDVTTVVDPDRNAKVRGIFKPFSFHISPEREISFYKFPLAIANPSQTAAPKATDDEILDAAAKFLEEMAEPVTQQNLVSRVCDLTGAGQKRVRALIVQNAEREDAQQKKGLRFWYRVGKNNKFEYRLPEVEGQPEQPVLFDVNQFGRRDFSLAS